MDTDRGLQDTVTRNVRVLMAIHGIHEQQELAARMGWRPAVLNKRLNGTLRWALDDLVVLADVFGLAPGTILGDTSELVGAAHPAAASGVSEGVMRRYPGTNTSPQVTLRPRRHLRLVAAQPARPITGSDHRPQRTHNALTASSSNRVTGVTAGVGS